MADLYKQNDFIDHAGPCFLLVLSLLLLEI
jgi:hypothetical protein